PDLAGHGNGVILLAPGERITASYERERVLGAECGHRRRGEIRRVHAAAEADGDPSALAQPRHESCFLLDAHGRNVVELVRLLHAIRACELVIFHCGSPLSRW